MPACTVRCYVHLSAAALIAILVSFLTAYSGSLRFVWLLLSSCPAGLSRLTSLRWLCLRWLDRLPVAYLAPLTNLVALQLKNIDKPPGMFVFLGITFSGCCYPWGQSRASCGKYSDPLNVWLYRPGSPSVECADTLQVTPVRQDGLVTETCVLF